MRTIEQILTGRRIRDLADIGFRLLAEPPEQRHSRQAWISCIAENLRDMPESFRLAFDPDDLLLLREKIRQVKGKTEQSEAFTWTIREVEQDSSFHAAMKYMQDMGLAWRERSAWSLRTEACKLLQFGKEETEFLYRMQTMYETMQGYLMLYGVIALDELGTILGVAETEDADRERELLLGVWRSRSGLGGISVADGRIWLIAFEVDDRDRIFAARQEKKVEKLDYASYTPEEANDIAMTTIPGREQDYKPMYRFLKKQGIVGEDADALLSMIIEDAQNGDTDGALEVLTNMVKTPPTPRDIEMIGGFFNSIPRWELKGHSYAELAEGTVKKQKPKRDDPCPCGSGRRYKNCCGNLQ